MHPIASFYISFLFSTIKFILIIFSYLELKIACSWSCILLKTIHIKYAESIFLWSLNINFSVFDDYVEKKGTRRHSIALLAFLKLHFVGQLLLCWRYLVCFGCIFQLRALSILSPRYRCHLALLNLLSHVSSCIIDVLPLVCPLRLYLCCTVFHLFSAIFHFVSSPFHHRHASLVSWCWYTFHLVVFNPPLVSLVLWCIALCFPFISSTVCSNFRALFRFGEGPYRKHTHLEIAAHVHSVCSLIIQHIFSQQWRNMHTKYLERKDKHTQYINIGHKQFRNKILLTSIIGKSSD